MTASSDIRQRARELIEQLPGDSLTKAVEFMETLSQSPSEPSRQTQEQQLLAIIQRQLTPDEQARLTDLRQRQADDTITGEEHQELLAFVDRVEQQDAERAAALVQLAELRQVELKTLVNEFLPESRFSHAS
jgi:hypothetical protein